MLILSSKGVNTIEMISYGGNEPPGSLVGFEFKLGYKERTCIEKNSCQELSMSLLAKHGMKSTSRK